MTATSARGLFHATGKRSKPVKVRDLITGEITTAAALERAADDFQATPPDPTRSFMHVEGDRLRDFKVVWEPAAGDGAMVREIRALGFDVFASDLVDRGCGATIRSFYDFDLTDAPSLAIVTNPPFAEVNWKHGKARWLYHALDAIEASYMALLLPLGFPAAAGLADLWHRHPPARIYVMRWRIDFTGQGAPPATNAWFVWDKTWQGETAFRVLDRADARQGDMFAEARAT